MCSSDLFIEWSIELPESMPANDLIVEAQYIINHYSLTYYDWDESVLFTAEFDYGSLLDDVKVNEPSRIGYSFLSWSEILPRTMPDEDIRIEAFYSIKQYSITFKDSDGTIIFTQSYDYNSDLTKIVIESPSKTGYTFIGWSEVMPNIMPDYDLTLEAIYQINQYTITFLGEDGKTIIRQDLVNYGETIQIPIIVMDYETETHLVTFVSWSPYLPNTVMENQTFTPIYLQTLKLSLENANEIANQFDNVNLKDFAALKTALNDLTVFAEYYPEQLYKVRMAVEEYKALVTNATNALDKSNSIDNRLIFQIVSTFRLTDFALISREEEEL